MDEISPERQHVVNPVKPLLEDINTGSGSVVKTVVSILLYVLAYYFFFRQHFIWILAITAIVLVHELGHFAAMKSFGYKDVQMFFVPLIGGFVAGESKTASQRQKVITLFAGPVPGIVIGAILIGIFYQDPKYPLLNAFSLLLIALNGFNLLPVKPLDGGQLFEKVLTRRWEIIQLLFLMTIAGSSFFWAVRTLNYAALLLTWFILYRLRKLWVVYNIRKSLNHRGISYRMPYDALTDTQYLAIRSILVPKVRALKHLDPNEPDAEEELSVALWVEKILVPPMKLDMTRDEKMLAMASWLFLTALSLFLVVRFFDYLSIFRLNH